MTHTNQAAHAAQVTRPLFELESIAHRYARGLMNAANATYGEDTEKLARQAKAALTSALQAFLDKHAAPAGDQLPVKGESRFVGQEWTPCSTEHVAMVLSTPDEWEGYEVRYLYAAPVQIQQLMQEVHDEFIKDGHGGEFEDGEHPLADRVRAFLAGAPKPEADGYPPLPRGTDAGSCVSYAQVFNASEMRAYVDADRAMRQAAPAAVAVPTDEEIIALLGDPKRSSINAVREALRRWGAAPAAPMVQPEPARDDAYTRRVIEALQENGDPVSVDAAEEMERLRALLAGVSAPAADLVALANTLPSNPSSTDFLAVGQQLAGNQPRLQDLADRAATRHSNDEQ